MLTYRELRQYANRKIFIGLLAMIFVAIATTAVAMAAILSLLATNATSRAIRARQLALDAVYLSVRTAESSQRGYLLTGMASYLTPYNQAAAQLPAQVRALKQLTNGTTDVPQINAIVSLEHAKITELAQTVAEYKSGDQTGALAQVTNGNGEAIMNQLSAAVSRLDTQESNLLAAKRQVSSNLGDLSIYVVIIALIVTLMLAALIYYLFLKAIASERELDRAKDEFVSLASHQLRTPATGIKSILSMIISGDFGSINEKQHHYLTRALESNERGIGIIEELLNVAKADAGRLVLRPAEMDICQLVETIIAEQRPAMESKNLQIEFTTPNEPLRVLADQEKLYMAIGNLVDNARKYTPEKGRIEVSLRGRRGVVAIEVADSGMGIDEADIGRIFDRFHRARGVVAASVDGTGLGLYLARRIAELHDGTIEVASKKGYGSRFTLTIPIGRV